MNFYFAAKMAVAAGVCLGALWVPGSLTLTIFVNDMKNWPSVFIGGLLVISLLFGALAAALAIIGWAFT